jgi:hypothetical protein
MIRIHPTGGVHGVDVDTNRVFSAVLVAKVVAVCVAVGVSLCMGEAVIVGVGKLCGNVAGIWVGVEGAGKDSASASMMPPTTKTTETIAMMIPTPN